MLDWLIYFLGAGAVAIAVFSYFDIIVSTKLTGFVLILLAFFLGFVAYRIYWRAGVKNLPQPEPLSQIYRRHQRGEAINLAQYFSLEAAVEFLESIDVAQNMHHLYLDTIHLAYTLANNPRIEYLLSRTGIDPRVFLQEAEEKLATLPHEGRGLSLSATILRAISQSLAIAASEKHSRIQVGDLLAAIASTDPTLKQKFTDLGLSKEDILNIVYWESTVTEEREARRRFWERPSRRRGIGRDWAAGYTPTLSRFAHDVTGEIEKKGFELHLIGHGRTIEEIERILSRSAKANVLLLGEPGVGKKTVVYGFAKKVLEGKALGNLSFKHVMELDVAALLSGVANPGELNARVKDSFNDAVRAGNIILYIDEIDNLFGGGGGEVGVIDASEIIAPYLASSQIQIIGSTTYEAYHQTIERNSMVTGNFSKIEMSPPATDDVIRILEDVAPRIERRTGVVFSYQAIAEIVRTAERYIGDRPFPEKGIDVMDDVGIFCATGGKRIVSVQDVWQVISQRVKVPVGEVKAEEKEKLLRLEEILHQRVIDQEEGIRVISEAMRRARAGLAETKRPIGTFLFLGPTGVGKTETSKALAQAYFGSEKAMIRLDMNEYQTVDSINRLIGSPPGVRYVEAGGELTRAVREKPFTVVLLDEIEKAHSNVLNLFLQVLDEGRLVDNLGRTVDFTNTIIIGTSNAGSELIREAVKSGEDQTKLKDRLLEYLQREGIFRPEFLNRFDAVVAFKPLSLKEIRQVAQLMIDKVNQQLKEREIQVRVTPEALNLLAQLGYDPTYGARPMRRVIQEKVENLVANKLISGEVKRGAVVEVGVEDIKVK